MRLHFQVVPWDLYLTIGYTAASSILLVLVGGGNLAAVFLIFFVPGYVIVAALFPANTEIDWIERIALSFGMSICMVPLLGLLIILTSREIRLTTLVAVIAIFTIGVAYAAYSRRMSLSPEDRLDATLNVKLPGWQRYGPFDKVVTPILVTGVVIAGATLAHFVLIPGLDERFTEFYILGPDGKGSGYPTSLNVSQNGSVIIGIANHEAATVTSTLRVDLVGVRIISNTTGDSGQTIEVNRTIWSWFNVTLVDGQNWTLSYTFSIHYVGLWKVQFLLFKDGDMSSPYKELHLYVVTS